MTGLIEIRRLDGRTAPEGALQPLHELHVERTASWFPTDPPMPWSRRLAGWRGAPPHLSVPHWLATHEGRPLGMAGSWGNNEQNTDYAEAWVWVTPDARGMGAGRALIAAVLDSLRAEGRVNVSVMIPAGRPGEGLAERLGMRPVFEEKISRLRLANVDWDLMHRWVTRAEERAGFYELIEAVTPFPDDVLAGFCAASVAMHDAPKGDTIIEDEVMTPEMWRGWEEGFATRGTQVHLLAAVDARGEWAGYTMIHADPSQPYMASQWDTAVRPDHRGLGLGRLLKAEMLLRFVETHPETRWLDTANAGSNEPMLRINTEMGYRTELILNEWQGPVRGVRDALIGADSPAR